MTRMALWVTLWVATVGLLEIDVRYSDGLHIQLHNWWGFKR